MFSFSILNRSLIIESYTILIHSDDNFSLKVDVIVHPLTKDNIKTTLNNDICEAMRPAK